MAIGATPSRLLAAACFAAMAAAPALGAETGISGLWLQQHAEHARHLDPPLTAQAQAEMEAQRKSAKVLGDASRLCLPVGMPRMMINELPFEVVESAERVAIISEQTELGRTVYLNTATHPANDEQPTWNGNSWGKWDKGVLVVDTTGFNDRVAHIPGTAKGSPSTHLVERFHLEDGGKVLVDEMTFEDPKLLTKPFVVVNHYDRLPQGSQRWEYVCDTQDPGWNTALGVKPEASK